MTAPPSVDVDLTATFADAGTTEGDRAVAFCTPAGDGRYDGIWQVASRDAVPELEWLLPQVARHTGLTVERVAVNPGAWEVPHETRFRSGGHLVKIGWSPSSTRAPSR